MALFIDVSWHVARYPHSLEPFEMLLSVGIGGVKHFPLLLERGPAMLEPDFMLTDLLKAV